MTGSRTIIDNSLYAWSEPEPLGEDLPPVMALDSKYLPSSFRPLVDDVSERMQTPPDYAAAASVAALAGCVGRRVFVQPRANDPSWRKPCNLWGAIIGPPGLLKSPVIEAVARPLFTIEELWRTEYKSELSALELQREEAELDLQVWRDMYRQIRKKGGDDMPARPDTSIQTPVQRRLVLQDATFEKLHEILSENPVGVLVQRDELTGWLAELDRQGREGERAFYLSAWNGTTGHSIERIGRGSVYVPACCVSLFGGIQPGRLRTYLQDALEDGPANDGLMQRFQNLVWPDPPKHWRLVDRLPDKAAERQAFNVFERLAGLPAENPKLLKFSPEAQQLFNTWNEELEHNIRCDTIHPAMAAHLAKYRSFMPVVSGLFELADWAAGLGGGTEISLAHSQQSAAFCEYLESHARRAYSCIVSPELRAARELSRHISAGELGGDRFTVRQVYRHDWSGLTTPNQVRAAVEILEDAGWIRQAPQEPGAGRPSEAFDINPAVVRGR